VFAWDENKSKDNLKKHGFAFNEILEVFNDPYLHEVYDIAHSTEEENRYKCLGCLRGLLIILVVISDKHGRRRIISARKATAKERTWYYETIKEKT
jgi:uncharacterized DUF497 family protein